MIRIYADFNSQDVEGRVILNTVGALRDIEAQTGDLAEGVQIVLYMPDEFELIGTLSFDGVWKATPNLDTIVYF
jgi:hypothetical protein